MLNYKELMFKIEMLQAVVKDLSKTIAEVCVQSSEGLNPTADLCQNIYQDIVHLFHPIPISSNIQIKHLMGMLMTEFSKEQFAMTANSTDYALFYQNCKTHINTQFKRYPDKISFLHLLLMLELIDKPQTIITNDHIRAGFKLFKQALETSKAQAEFEEYFARGAMIDFDSLAQFIEGIESFLNPIPTHEQPSTIQYKQ